MTNERRARVDRPITRQEIAHELQVLVAKVRRAHPHVATLIKAVAVAVLCRAEQPFMDALAPRIEAVRAAYHSKKPEETA